ncbi:MAG TPA: hypothetical protein VGN37_26975 [Actinocatenispora sp.]
MSRRVYYDEDAQPYYQLVCDGCGGRFLSFDDSCYDWDLLREAAEYDGWNAADPAGPHHCPQCVRTGLPAALASNSAAV